MARQQHAGAPRAEEQRGQQNQQNQLGQQAGQAGREGQAGGGVAASTGGAGAQGTSARSGTVESRGDRERERPVSRESAGGLRTTGGRSGAGSPLAGRGHQPSLLPALMANPSLMASAFMSNPYAFAEAISEEMDRIFAGGDLGGSSFGQPGGGLGRGLVAGGSPWLQQQGGRGLAQWTPQIELFQRGNELVVRADLPGLRPEDMQIEIEDGVLTLSGERRQSSEGRQEGYYRSERSYGSFSRSIPLPEGVDDEQVQARFEHGELELTIPLPQHRSRARRVQIQSGRGQQQHGASQQEGERENGGQHSAGGRQGGVEEQR